jgi:hypothetical protein
MPAAAAIALALWLALAGTPALVALRPLQAAVLKWLLPEFRVERLALETAAGTLRLSARAITTEHLVLRGRVLAPGIVFDAHTPARQTLRVAVVSVLVCALAWVLGAARCRRSVLVAAAIGLAATLLAAPIVLAGQMWALGVDGLGEPSRRALLVEASRVLLHGGDMAVVAVLCMVLSDHARPWSRRTMAGPADEGVDTPASRAA